MTIGRTITNTFAGIRPVLGPAVRRRRLVGAALAVAAVSVLYPHMADSAADVIVPHQPDIASHGAPPRPATTEAQL